MNNNFIKKFKRASAGALAAAVIAMGTSCGYVEPVESTPRGNIASSSIETSTKKITKYPFLAEFNDNLYDTIVAMVNKYYRDNFDFRIVDFDIKDITVTPVGFSSDGKALSLVKINMDINDAIVSNSGNTIKLEHSISYVVSSDEVAQYSYVTPLSSKFEEFAKALNKCTIEKIEKGDIHEKDKIYGWYVEVDYKLLRDFVGKYIDPMKEAPIIIDLKNAGNHVDIYSDNLYNWDFQGIYLAYVKVCEEDKIRELQEFSINREFDTISIHLLTIKDENSGEVENEAYLTYSTNVKIHAINKKTREEENYYYPLEARFKITADEYNKIYNYIKENAKMDIEEYINSIQPSKNVAMRVKKIGEEELLTTKLNDLMVEVANNGELDSYITEVNKLKYKELTYYGNQEIDLEIFK